MLTLDEIGYLTGTDKSSRHHNYLEYYDIFLSRFRDKKPTLLELGMLHGDSVRMWEQYLPHADIYAVDINEERVAMKFNRAQTRLGDCGSKEVLTALGQEIKPTIVLDDASHYWEHQIVAFESLFPHLESGGVYIVEDIQGSFGPRRTPMGRGYPVDAFTYLMRLQALLVGQGKLGPLVKSASETQAELVKDIQSVNIMCGTAVVLKK